MASTPLLIPVGYQLLTNAGQPNAGGFLYTYAAGSTTPQNTYSDNGLSVLNPNPIPLNSAGRCAVSGVEVNVYPIGANYKLVLTDSSGTTIWTHDFVNPSAGWDVLVGTLTGLILASPTVTGGTFSSITLSTAVSGLLAQVCQGRLTLTSGLPVTTADVTGATSVFFTPYTGNLIGLFDGISTWTALAFSELTLNLGTLSSGLPYDVFAFNNSGVVALRSPVAWTNTTTRATALTLQNGIYVKTGATTDRYLGTFCTSSTTQTEDSAAKRFLWNYYNRIVRFLNVNDVTASWAYTTATWRQARAQTTNQVELMAGVAEDALHAEVRTAVSNDTGAAVNVGIGEDSTTAPVSAASVGSVLTVAGMDNANLIITATLNKIPAAGYHKYVWLEASAATGTTTFGGASSVTAGGNTFGSGISATWKA